MRYPGLLGLLIVGVAWLSPHAAHAALPQCGAPTKKNYNTVTCYIDPTLDPAAVCNDGTLPVFWYRPGSGSGTNQWLIWLGGGGDCDSDASCAVRVSKPGQSYTLTSNGFVATPGQGLTSAVPSTNPMLYNANTIYLHYCSSDTWAGNHLSTVPFDINNSSTWSFEGRRVATASITSLRELYPALSVAKRIIIGGDSSGGVGIIEVANDILPLLPASATKLIVNDAGFSLDVGQFFIKGGYPFVNTAHPNAFETDVQQRILYWNSRGDAVCDAGATTLTQHINCYNTSYVLENGFITVPVFVANALLDTAQVTQELCPTHFGYCPVDTNPVDAEGIYATTFGSQMAAAISAPGSKATYTSYAPDQYLHVILHDDTQFVTPLQFPQGPIAPRDVFDAWLANPTATRVTYIGNAPGVD